MMTDEQMRAELMRKIWNERANGMSVSEIARIHDITEGEVREILGIAPTKYSKEYCRACRMSPSAYDALPPHRRHDKI